MRLNTDMKIVQHKNMAREIGLSLAEEILRQDEGLADEILKETTAEEVLELQMAMALDEILLPTDDEI